MDRRHFVGLIIAASLAGTLASASAFADEIMRQLQGDGYSDIIIETTWLGRVRITAVADGGAREIILNPSTGEILRDLWIPIAGGAISTRLIKDSATTVTKTDDGSGSGSSGRDDNRDDNESDDDRNDDKEDD